MLLEDRRIVTATLNLQNAFRPGILHASLQQVLSEGVTFLSFQENDGTESDVLLRSLATGGYDLITRENLGILFNESEGITPVSRPVYVPFVDFKSWYSQSSTYQHGAVLADFAVERGVSVPTRLVMANVHLHSGVNAVHSTARALELIKVDTELRRFGRRAVEAVGQSNVIYAIQGDFNSMSERERTRNNHILKAYTHLSQALLCTHNPGDMEPGGLSHDLLIWYGKTMMKLGIKPEWSPLKKSLDSIYMHNGRKIITEYLINTFIRQNMGSDHFLVMAELRKRRG